MIARIQQISTVTLLFLSIIWGAFFWYRGTHTLATTGAVVILLGYMPFLGFEFLLLALFGNTGPIERPRWSELVRAWAGEVWRTPLVFCWWQPFRSHSEPDILGRAKSGRRGVVFVHGFVCNRGLWNPWMKVLRRRGISFFAVNLEPPFGSIAAYSAIIDAAARSVEAATGELPVIVAHSMGGLAVRAWLAAHGDAQRVHRVITIGTPHRGTWLARFGHTQNGIEMRPSSDWIKALERRERETDRVRFICFYGNCDNIVFPTSTATLPGAENRHLPATAHAQMAYHPEVMREVLKWLVPVPMRARAEPVQISETGSQGEQRRR